MVQIWPEVAFFGFGGFDFDVLGHAAFDVGQKNSMIWEYVGILGDTAFDPKAQTLSGIRKTRSFSG